MDELEITAYNWTLVMIPAGDAVSLVLKQPGAAIRTESTIVDNQFHVTTDNWPIGKYYFQGMAQDGSVVLSGVLDLRQNLAHADTGFDPRSRAEITIEAIDAMLAGRATSQQRRIQVGDKSIEYSSYDELMKWRQHFVDELRREQGKKPFRREVAVFK